MKEEKKVVVIDLPNRQICDVEYSEEIEGYLVIKRSNSVRYEVINKETGRTRAEFTPYVHFTTREDLVAKIKDLD